MPFEGDYTQETYASQMLADYAEAGIPPEDVYPQSFRIEDVRYWIEQHPDFGRQAVYLDDRDETQPGFVIGDPASWRPSMAELRADRINILAPPLWMLVEPGPDGTIVPSAYAREAKAAGLGLIPWSLERSPPLSQGGSDWYYQTVEDVATRDGDILTLLDVLGRDIRVIGVFSDWPATTTFYANCVRWTEAWLSHARAASTRPRVMLSARCHAPSQRRHRSPGRPPDPGRRLAPSPGRPSLWPGRA